MESYFKVAGIYTLTCIKNGKVYVGKSVNIGRRLNEHRNCGNKTKGKYFFQNVIIKHGWESFTVEILETISNFDKLKDNSTLLEREKYYIDLLDTTNVDKGYNICKSSTDKTGIPHSEETKEKLRQANLGKKLSEETKARMSKSKMGHTTSSETREKLRTNGKGRIVSEETKERLRKPKPESMKEKMRGNNNASKNK